MTQPEARDRAAEIIKRGDAGEIIGMALRARAKADEGVWCECRRPITHGVDLLCGACLLNNQEQVRLATLRIVAAHPFTPSDGRMCGVCSGWEDDPRHGGEHKVGHTSWGEEVVVDPWNLGLLHSALNPTHVLDPDVDDDQLWRGHLECECGYTTRAHIAGDPK